MFKRFKYKSRQLHQQMFHLIWQNNAQLWKLLITTLWDFLEKNYANRIILIFWGEKRLCRIFKKVPTSLPLSPPLPAALTAAGGSGRAGEIPPYPAARTLPPSYFSLFSIHSRILRYPHTALILVFCPSYYSKLKTKKIHPVWWSLEDWIHNCIREQIKQKHFSNFVSFVNFEMEFLL